MYPRITCIASAAPRARRPAAARRASPRPKSTACWRGSRNSRAARWKGRRSRERMSAPGAWSTAEGAASWQASIAQRQQSLAAATELLFAWAGIGPGMRVLEVGSGTGDLVLLAAGRIGPAGSVLATDASAPMLEV